MTTSMTGTGGALRLLAEILARYGTLEAFLARVRCELDDPTVELPRVDISLGSQWADPAGWPVIPVPSISTGRHARTDG